VGAASATIEDPAAVAARYLLDASLVMVGQRRRILARIAIADGPTQVEREFERMVDRGFRKILAFARSREEVEAYVKALQGRPPFGSDVLAHHGSLGRAERLRVEHQFLTRPAALCFATTTLELGIDIGDIDLIAVLGAPFAVTSLIQQAGRGGRRASRNPLLALARDPFDASVFRVMLEAAAEGRLLEPSPLFRAGVLVQQALSILHENPGRWVSPAALRARLPDDLRTEWDEKRLGCLLDHMTRRNWLERGGERYSLGERGERMWSRVLLHSNLRERGGVLVRDSMTGDEVGRIAVAESQSLSLGGKARQVLLRDGGAVVTRSFGGGDLPIFADGALPLVSRELARRILEEVGIPVPSRSHIDGVVLFHGLGSAASLLLGKVMELAGAGVRRSGPLAVVVDSLPFDWPSPEMANKAVSRSHAQLARSLSLGSFHHELPVDEQRRLVTQAVHLDEVRAFLERGPPPPVEHDDEEDAAWW
jgi:ATP-dependent Lhr-like helicase